jgi:hypothetical protein
LNEEVGDGYAANYATVERLSRLAKLRSTDPKIRALALQLTQHLPSHNYLDESKAIATWVQQNMRYVRDIRGVETIHDPLTLLEQATRGVAAGDCDDHVVFIASMLLSIGHNPFFRIVKYRPETLSFNHIYMVDYDKNGARAPKQRIVLDAIVKDKPIGFEVKHANGEELAV